MTGKYIEFMTFPRLEKNKLLVTTMSINDNSLRVHLKQIFLLIVGLINIFEYQMSFVEFRSIIMKNYEVIGFKFFPTEVNRINIDSVYFQIVS